MTNLEIYKKYSIPPDWAKKEIQAGRLKGKTDINPQWRIECLTEQFGPVGIGWYYDVTKQWIEIGGKDEKAAFVNVSLYVKHEGNWSMSIQGSGGASIIASEKNGLYTSDECFKMATTDALSVACKMLGIGASIYSGSKYPTAPQQPQAKTELLPNTEKWNAAITYIKEGKATIAQIKLKYELSQENEVLLTDLTIK